MTTIIRKVAIEVSEKVQTSINTLIYLFQPSPTSLQKLKATFLRNNVLWNPLGPWYQTSRTDKTLIEPGKMILEAGKYFVFFKILFANIFLKKILGDIFVKIICAILCCLFGA